MSFDDDCAFFKENKAVLSRLYYGLWGVIKDRTIVGLFPLSCDALKFAELEFGSGVAAVVQFDESPEFGCKHDALSFWRAFGWSQDRDRRRGRVASIHAETDDKRA